MFLWGLVPAVLALLATLLIREIPLRDTVHNAQEAGREMLDTLALSDPDPSRVVLPLGRLSRNSRTHERMLGLRLSLLAGSARRSDRPFLQQAATTLGGGDLERGIALLERTA